MSFAAASSNAIDPAPGARRPRVEDLYHRFGKASFAFFIRKVGDASRAADLNQELYLHLARALENYEGRCSHRTYVFAVARVILARDRSKRWSGLESRTVTLEAASFANDLGIDVDPDGEAAAVLFRERLRRCLRRLDDAARATVVSHYFRGLTLREVTERLALTNPSGARGLLLRAQRSLKRCLEGGGDR